MYLLQVSDFSFQELFCFPLYIIFPSGFLFSVTLITSFMEGITLWLFLMCICTYLSFLNSLFSFYLFSFYLFFWLHYIFVVVHGLSLVAASGGYSLLWCAGFSLWWLLLLRSMGSRCAGFSSCGSWALEHRLSSCGTWA